MTKKIIIIGGGISGLAAAFRLTELQKEKEIDMEITVLEAKERFGGIIETLRQDGLLMEGGPESFITEKPWALNLCRRLGIEGELIKTREEFRKSFIFGNGRLNPVPKGFYLIVPGRLFAFLNSKIISLRGKFRILKEFFVPKRQGKGDESVAGFVRRRFGEEALEKIAQPMIGGIYTADLEKLSLQATFPKFQEMESEFGSLIRGLRKTKNETSEASGPRYSLFVTLRDGMQRLVEALIQKMPQVDFCANSRVKTILKNKETGRWRVLLMNGEFLTADAVCIATPSYIAGILLEKEDPYLTEKLREIIYESTATINMVFRREDIKRPLNGFGFVVPQIENLITIGCTFSSTKFADRSPEKYVLLRAFVGGAFRRDIFSRDRNDIKKKILQELTRILDIRGEPLRTTFHRWQRSMPQYHLGHLQRVAAIEKRVERLQSLRLAGNAYHGIGVPDCIKSGEDAAEGIVEYLGKQTSPLCTSVVGEMAERKYF